MLEIKARSGIHCHITRDTISRQRIEITIKPLIIVLGTMVVFGTIVVKERVLTITLAIQVADMVPRKTIVCAGAVGMVGTTL